MEILSLSSMSGMTKEKSMKMMGRIGNKEVVVLIDSGATSNFISERFVSELGLTVSDTRGFGVRVGGGQILKGKGKCAGLLLGIQGVEILDEFLVFDLGTIDVVLGYAWLETLGDTRTNWKSRTLSWKIGALWVTIKGDPALSKEQISFNSMEKVIKHNGEAYLLELTTLFEGQEQPSKKTTQIEEVNRLVHRFEVVFNMANHLPP